MGIADVPSPDQIGVVIVDHGSRRDRSNRTLLEIVAMFERQSRFSIVEAAHMELAEPSIETAFGRCVQRGARLILVHPCFVLPGRHWNHDIPALAARAARRAGGVPFLVTEPLGCHPLLARIIDDRITQCLEHAATDGMSREGPGG